MTGQTFLTGPAAPNITGFDVINLFSAAISIVLAIVALALSIFFFVQSKKAADQASKSADEISASVRRLEKIFDSLYSDTFAIMRDTVTDMRHHVWKMVPAHSASNEGDNSVENQRSISQSAMLEELGKVSRHVGLTDAKISELTARLSPVIDRILEEQQRTLIKSVVANERTFQEQLLKILQDNPMSLRELTKVLQAPEDVIVDTVFYYGKQGMLTWSGFPNSLTSDVPIYYKPDVRGKASRDSASSSLSS